MIVMSRYKSLLGSQTGVHQQLSETKIIAEGFDNPSDDVTSS